MKAKETMVAWNNNGAAKAGPWPDTDGWSQGYDAVAGACYTWYGQGSADDIVLDVMRLFSIMVMRDGVDPQSAYAALRKINEYRDNTPADMP